MNTESLRLVFLSAPYVCSHPASTACSGYAALHVLGHACFKACLFMLSGILLHTHGVQDSRSISAAYIITSSA